MHTQEEKLQYINLLLGSIKTSQMLAQMKEVMEDRIQELYYDPNIYGEIMKSETPMEKKEKILNEFMLKRNVPALAQKFLLMLLHRNLFDMLDDQDKPTFLLLFRNEVKSISAVTFTCANYLSDYVLNWVYDEVRSLIKYRFVLDVQVNQSIMGGIILQTDHLKYEDTVVTRLNAMGKSIRERIHALTMAQLDNIVKDDFEQIRQQDGSTAA